MKPTQDGTHLGLGANPPLQYDDPVAIVIDADMDGGPGRDVVDFRSRQRSEGGSQAVETGEHAGRFIGGFSGGRHSRDSEIQLPPADLTPSAAMQKIWILEYPQGVVSFPTPSMWSPVGLYTSMRKPSGVGGGGIWPSPGKIDNGSNARPGSETTGPHL